MTHTASSSDRRAIRYKPSRRAELFKPPAGPSPVAACLHAGGLAVTARMHAGAPVPAAPAWRPADLPQERRSGVVGHLKVYDEY